MREKQAVIIVHEIYGVNSFIKQTRRKLEEYGYEVYCPNLLGREPFSYEEVTKAYEYFRQKVGFDQYIEINKLLIQLKQKYEKVYIIGFSVGATIAWRCSENASCDGVIDCYGSRIRDYMECNPVCETLLLFAKRDSFDVEQVIQNLQGKPHVRINKYEASHGFMDPFSTNFNKEQQECAIKEIKRWLLQRF